MYMAAGTNSAVRKRKLKSGLGTWPSFENIAREREGNGYATSSKGRVH
jgi:hypothetical protein